jgi:CDGSH-type Zn-finger protein
MTGCASLEETKSKKGETMADVTIRALKDGPYEVSGGAKVFDHQGKEYQEDQFEPVYLCRCGHSKNKPFCDGSHEDEGFKSEETVGS